MTGAHPLDRPVWTALATGWAALAEGGPFAKRLLAEVGPFAAADGSAAGVAALAGLVPDIGETWLVEAEAQAAPPGTVVLRTATLAQMVAERMMPGDAIEAEALGAGDAAEMAALAALTQPGPFGLGTYRLGGFIGVREDGRLIAMAGERMRLPGFAEVSGVCTHPDYGGRGLARGLMRTVMARMIARGDVPVLHAYAAHRATVALYGTLGFVTRREMVLTVVGRGLEPR